MPPWRSAKAGVEVANGFAEGHEVLAGAVFGEHAGLPVHVLFVGGDAAVKDGLHRLIGDRRRGAGGHGEEVLVHGDFFSGNFV